MLVRLRAENLQQIVFAVASNCSQQLCCAVRRAKFVSTAVPGIATTVAAAVAVAMLVRAIVCQIPLEFKVRQQLLSPRPCACRGLR